MSNHTQDTQKDFLNALASNQAIQNTMDSLEENGFTPHRVSNGNEALEKVKELIPDGVTIMNGASRSLEQIGMIDLLIEEDHNWDNLHSKILAEEDPVKQVQLRREATLSDYYVGSVHALTETGEMLIASNTGSQLPHLAFTSPNIVLVVGANKIVKDLTEAFERLNSHVIPLEDERMQEAYGAGTLHSKSLILHKENRAFGRNVHVIIVEEELWFSSSISALHDYTGCDEARELELLCVAIWMVGWGINCI